MPQTNEAQNAAPAAVSIDCSVSMLGYHKPKRPNEGKFSGRPERRRGWNRGSTVNPHTLPVRCNAWLGRDTSVPRGTLIVICHHRDGVCKQIKVTRGSMARKDDFCFGVPLTDTADRLRPGREIGITKVAGHLAGGFEHGTTSDQDLVRGEVNDEVVRSMTRTGVEDLDWAEPNCIADLRQAFQRQRWNLVALRFCQPSSERCGVRVDARRAEHLDTFNTVVMKMC